MRAKMPSMGRGRTAAIAGVTAALLGATAAHAAPGTLLDIGRDDGLPVAFAKGTATSPRTLLVRVKAKPSRPVEVRWDTSCAVGGKGKVREGELTVSGTKVRRLKKGFRRPENCLVNAIAAYEDAAIAGRIKIELFARG